MPGDATLERPLPHNLEAERSMLGAILLDNHALNAAIEKLRRTISFCRSTGRFSSAWCSWEKSSRLSIW